MGHIKSAFQLAAEMKDIIDRADQSQRDLTVDERAQIEGMLVEIKSKKRIEDLGRDMGMPNVMTDGASAHTFTDPGAMFVNSEGYKAIVGGHRGESWSTGLIEVGGVGLSMKGTLLEGAGSPGSGSGGGLLPVPQVVPGIVSTLFRPLVLEDLLLSGVATGNTVRYVTQGTATSGAAGVAEGGTKPESTLGFGTADEAIKKIATSITLSDEVIEDAPAIQTFVNNQLSLFVRVESERQLLRGTSGGNEVQGLLTSRSVPIYAGGTAAGNKAVQIFKAMAGQRGSANLEPEWTIMHPDDWRDVRLLTDTAGQFYGGGPFQGPYGSGQSYGASGQLTGAVDMLWNKPVYLSPLVGVGTAMIGNSQSAQVWNRGGMRVEATNSHSSNFTLNLSVIRAERRLGLTLYRPTGFTEIRLA